MKVTLEMDNPQETLLEELEYKGITQESVAITYAFLIAQEGKTADFAKVNAAICQKWHGKKALMRVKEMAWKHVERWSRKSVPE